MKTSVYHYTSLSAFESMLQNSVDKSYLTFWASNVRYMNDPIEMEYGKQKAIDFLERLEIIYSIDNKYKLSSFIRRENVYLTDLYSISFSQNYDFLPMWQAYADNGQGVCIHFCDLEYNIPKIYEVNGHKVIDNIIINGGLRTVPLEYGDIKIGHPCANLIEEEYKNYLRAIENRNGNIDELKYNASFKSLMYGAVLVKSSSFFYEKEQRLIIMKDRSTTIKQRNKNNKVIPYVENNIPKDLIMGVTFGPAFNKNNISKLEAQLLEAKLKISLSRSSIKYSII